MTVTKSEIALQIFTALMNTSFTGVALGGQLATQQKGMQDTEPMLWGMASNVTGWSANIAGMATMDVDVTRPVSPSVSKWILASKVLGVGGALFGLEQVRYNAIANGVSDDFSNIKETSLGDVLTATSAIATIFAIGAGVTALVAGAGSAIYAL